MNGAELIAAERERQVSVEGWTSKHDDNHCTDELARAAEAYIVIAWAQIQRLHWRWLRYEDRRRWPWGVNEMPEPKPDPVRNLVKAGALIAAEIDRLQRKAGLLLLLFVLAAVPACNAQTMT